MALPTSLAEITPEWLTAALSQRSPGTVVESVAIDDPIWGTATKVFLRVEYSVRGDADLPNELCLKGGFNDDMRAVAGYGYQVESRFYRDIAPSFGDSVPRAWYAEEDEANNQGLVLVDDLRGAGASFGGPSVPYSVDQVAAALEQLAMWHGNTWNRKGISELGWLTVGSQLFRPVVQSFLSAEHWARFIDSTQTRSFDDNLRDRERVERAVHRLWELDDADILSLSHGDPHGGNTYAMNDGVIRFLDWQTTCLAPWADDVTYFLVGNLDIEERRVNETALLTHYLEALRSSGADAPNFDDAWLSYRRHHLHGLMFALCPPEMQPEEVCTLMGDRYATAAIDHDTLSAIED